MAVQNSSVGIVMEYSRRPSVALTLITAASFVCGQETGTPALEDPGFRSVDPSVPAVIPALVPFATPTQPALIPLGVSPGQGEEALAPSGQSMVQPMPAQATPPLAEVPGTGAHTRLATGADLETATPWITTPSAARKPEAAAMSNTGSFTTSPNGFDRGWNSPDMAAWLDESFLEGLFLAGFLNATYDSNPYRGNAPGGVDRQSDFFLTLGGTVGYLSRASTWTYGLDYTGSYNQYFNNTDLGGYQQNAGAQVNYDGGPLNATLRAGIDYGSGANRYYASVVDQIDYDWGLNARYRLSPKTSLAGGLSQRFTSASGGSNADTSSTDFNLSALWKYSKLTEIGPGIRYTLRSGDAGGDRTSLGPTLTVNYQLSRKVSLNSRIGTDFVDYEDGGSADPSLYTSIGLNYRPSALWSMNLSLQRDSQASFSDAGRFEQITSLRLGYQRRILRASWNLGMSLETRSTENSGTAGQSGIPDRDYFSFDTSIGMPVFADTTQASLFLRYSNQDGGTNDTWDSFQAGFGLSRRF